MRSAVVIACVFLSGVAGLIYEVCWIREASLVFGSTTAALSTVLAVFFAGLAAGSYLFGRRALGTVRPLRLYAWLEALLAVAALVTLPGFALADAAFGLAYRALGGYHPLLAVVRTLLIALVVFVPTVLMGATLPLLCRHFVVRAGRIAGSVGALYAVNTLGAAVGCAATGFWLLPAIGARASVLCGAAINLAVAVVVPLLRLPPRDAVVATSSRAEMFRSRRSLIVMALFFASGFVALGAEVVWARYLTLLVTNTVHTYTITLTVVLLGIVVGSLLAAALFDRAVPLAASFGAIQVLAALSVITVMTLPPSFWRAFSSELMIEFVLLLAPASLAGASFPLAVRMVVRDPALAGFGVGLLAALNTAGGIVGALAVGFAVLPAFGLDATVRIVTGIGLAIGVAAWLALEPRGAAAARLAAAALAAVAWLGIPALTGTRLPADFLADPGELADYREGRVSNLAIVRRGDVEELQIDRWWQGENRKNHQFMAAHLPMLIHPEPRRVLVVGVGAGQTPGRFLMYEELDRLECVDIEPAIFDFIRPHFDSRWMQDDRVALIHADGRNHLMHTAAHYDVVSLEVGQLFRPGVATLYTTDFYRRVSERLEPGGLCAQFVPTPFLGVDQFRSVVRAFVDVFPQSALWYNTSELLLVGVNGAPVEIDLDRLERLVTDDEIGADLRYSYWGGAEHWLVRPEVLLGGYLCGPSGLAAIAAGAAALVDDRPRLEYATSHVDPLARREIPIVDLIRRHLDPVREVVRGELGPETLRAIDEMRDRNLGDVAAAANLRLVELDRSPLGTDRAVALLREALERNPASFACHRRLADVLVAAGRLAEAYPSFLAAVELRPDDVWSRRGLAFLLLRAGRVDEAIPHLRVALEHEPDDATTHNYLGAALAERGDLAEAIRHFESAARLAPGDTEIEANLARARRAGSGSP